MEKNTSPQFRIIQRPPITDFVYRDYIISDNLTGCLGSLLEKARFNYNLYVELITRFRDEYIELMKYDVDTRYNTIKFKYSGAEILIMAEYYLWVNNNDIERLKSLLSKFGKKISIYLAERDDIFNWPPLYDTSHLERPPFDINQCIISRATEDTKKLVHSMIDVQLNYYRASVQKRNCQNNNTSKERAMYNNFTGEYIRPSDDTYHIDDFR
ncbi:MAG: hypothetical protein HDS97_00770 [Bacteroidales bacterium]|nr:hypothetical protein [Bacteroidales bacterium]